MGLDMYLKAEAYLGKYVCGFRDPEDHKKAMPEDARAQAIQQIKALSWPKGSEAETFKIITTAVYWRKANAIHNWFVNHCADGVDECQKIPLTHEQMQQLYNLCLWLLVRKDNNLAAEYLPTGSGFLFGSTEYDDWYWQDVAHTAEGLRGILEYPEYALDYYYHASW